MRRPGGGLALCLAVVIAAAGGGVGRAAAPAARAEKTAHEAAPPAAPRAAAPLHHHSIAVTLDPVAHSLAAVDRLSLPPPRPDGPRIPPGFFLNASLTVDAVRAAGRPLDTVDPDPSIRYPGEDAASDDDGAGGDGGARLRFVRIELPEGSEPLPAIEVTYHGAVFEPLATPSREYARSFESTSGLIDTAGVFLSGATGWVPEVPGALVTFDMTVAAPAGYRSVSQGEVSAEEGREVWTCSHPQEEIYLIAGRYRLAEELHDGVLMQTYTYADDPGLTARYLEATANYLDMYTELLGPYPYAKFALVENFWQTGYGMPSFTLLGDQIIRMPWIISTSYGHEILHNWFGNGVFVVWERGNWCEGLTTYLADHLYKEQQGQGAAYRRSSLRGYRDYVRGANDLPLTEFRSRHDPVTQAVGYGKTMMVFHMLRRHLGDERFVAGLRRLVAEHLYAAADWQDVRRAFEAEADEDLGWFFEQWVERVGAPALTLGDPEVTALAEGHRLRVTVRQTGADPYRLSVPVAVALAGSEEPVLETLEIAGSTADIDRVYDARPVAVAVDPTFDVFRRLDRREIPPAFGEIFGAERVLIVLPGQAPDALQLAYQSLAAAWTGGGDQVEVLSDEELLLDAPAGPGSPRPDGARLQGRAIWVLGHENRLRGMVAIALAAYEAGVEGDSIRVVGRSFPVADRSFVFAVPHPTEPELSMGFVAADNAAAVPGLARKLPHYRKYGYLVFQGDEPTNVHKGEWPAVESPLVRAIRADRADDLPGAAAVAAPVDPTALPPPPPLIEKRLSFRPDKLMAHARALSTASMEGRGIGTAGLDRAGDYVAEQLRLAGLLPGGDDGYFQSWTAPAGPDRREVTLRNVIGILPGTDPAWQEACVLVGAHYDHLGRGWPDVHAGDEDAIHPGADDNASGVAVALELARIMAASAPPRRNVVFAFFTGEEAELLGSRHYVESPTYALDRTVAMINLDTVGRLGDRKLLIFGAGSTREVPHVIRGCSYVTGVPVDMVAAGHGSSDQIPFHERGVPAIQLFSGPHLDYHRPGDIADKLDGRGMAKIAAFVREAVQYLAARDEPLTWVAAGEPAGTARRPESAGADAPRPGGGGRRVALGTVPDFTHEGDGVRLEGTVPGSAAEAAGLEAGDVVIRLGDRAVATLRDLSAALKGYEPGTEVELVYLRAGEERRVRVTLTAR